MGPQCVDCCPNRLRGWLRREAKSSVTLGSFGPKRDRVRPGLLPQLGKLREKLDGVHRRHIRAIWPAARCSSTNWSKMIALMETNDVGLAPVPQGARGPRLASQRFRSLSRSRGNLGRRLHIDREVKGGDFAIFTRHLVNDVIRSDVPRTSLIKDNAGWGFDQSTSGNSVRGERCFPYRKRA